MRTIDVARKTGIAVNTVRLYERLGYLPAVPRTANGYRQFSERHLQHIYLIRQGMQCTWLGGSLRYLILDIFIFAAQGNFDRAETNAKNLIDHLQRDKTRAETAIIVLERWLKSGQLRPNQPGMQIGEVADYLDVSVDVLRNWERDGLLAVPRSTNGYRAYGPPEIDRLIVIRTLRQARYSTLSILRMFHKLEVDQNHDLRKALDMPSSEDDIIYATDHWLSTLTQVIAVAKTMQIMLQDIQTLH